VSVLLRNFNAKVGRECIFKPRNVNESLQENNDYNSVRAVNFATSKHLAVKSTMFPCCKIHKYIWVSTDGKTQNQVDHLSIDRRPQSSILGVRYFIGPGCDIDHCLMVSKLGERLSVSKRAVKKFYMQRFDLKKLIIF
jgi:hypothetical protein